MNILITGGTGYLGGRLTSYLKKVDQNKISIISRKKKCTDNSNVNFIRINWKINNQLSDACRDIDTIVHLAGMNSYDCNKNLNKAIATNVNNTINLLKIAEKCDVKQFIYLSTIHVYGANLSGMIDEKTKLNPTSNYSITKVMAENAILKFSKNSNIKCLIIRLSNAFGAPENINSNCWSLLFNDLCKQLVQNKKMIIKTDGSQKRNFISISEVCRAIQNLIFYMKYQKTSEVFNLGSSWTPSIIEAADLVKNLHQKIFHNDNISIINEGNKIQGLHNNFIFKTDYIKKTGIEIISDPKNEIINLINFCYDNF